MRLAAITFALLSGLLLLAVAGCGHGQRALLPIAEERDEAMLFRMPPLAEGGAPVVYLTIDDGPSASSDEILDMLDEFGAKATFFVHTDHINTAEDRATMVRTVRDGHGLGNHLPADEPAGHFSAQRFEESLAESQSRIKDLTGVQTAYFRPPQGEVAKEIMSPILLREGYRAPDGSDRIYILASFIPWDAGGLTETPSDLFNRVAGARYADHMSGALFDGAIVLFHDGPRTKRTETTLFSLKRFLRAAKRKGYVVKALPQ